MCQDLSNDTNTTVLTFFKAQMNIGLHLLETELGSFYMEETRTGSTAATTTAYQLPENFIRLKALYVTVGTTQYPCTEVFDEDVWRMLQATTQSSNSNYASHVFVRRETFELYPEPSSINTYTMIYEAEGKDLQNDDYSTGTITTLANTGTAVTGSSTTFTSAMVGRYFRINTDGQWYKIGTFTSTTSIALAKAYQGTAISAGSSAYTIGEMPRTPGPTHHIPVYFALWKYFEGAKKDKKFGDMYKSQWESYMQWAKETYGRRYSTAVIPSQRGLRRMGLVNPNHYPENMS